MTAVAPPARPSRPQRAGETFSLSIRGGGEAAAVVLFLASSAVGAVVGTDLVVDGGSTV
ncbi:hypothetical protein ACWCXK_38630 [Streptomyces sp. NPDC001739]